MKLLRPAVFLHEKNEIPTMLHKKCLCIIGWLRTLYLDSFHKNLIINYAFFRYSDDILCGSM